MSRLPPTRTAGRFATLLGFLRSEAAGGVLLILAAAVALVWANSPAGDFYGHLLASHVAILPDQGGVDWSLHAWVNDGLMALFFLLVALEIRREMTHGELASLRRMAGPGIAAIGGMVVPALIFTAFNWRNPGALRGWAVPVATDIAFSLAVLQVLGKRVPVAIRIFLTALAIMDDLGAIVVIALFYTAHLAVLPLVLAGLLWLGLFLLGRAGVRMLAPYLIGGVVLWYLVMRSGIHPTLAGVALAFAVPMSRTANDPDCPAERLEHGLSGLVSYFVVPLFGLTNAGLRLDALPAGALTDPLIPGIALGLFAGKQVGVFGATWLALRTGLARLPGHMSLAQLYGVAVLCGIGFTMSLFIGDLAFRGMARDEEVKLAVLAGSVVSALVGLAVLAFVTRTAATGTPKHPTG
jgi:NhaA family Na+:H+ antiporter